MKFINVDISHHVSTTEVMGLSFIHKFTNSIHSFTNLIEIKGESNKILSMKVH